MDEQVEITLTVGELEAVLDLVDETIKRNAGIRPSPLFNNFAALGSVDSKLHDAYESTDRWANL